MMPEHKLHSVSDDGGGPKGQTFAEWLVKHDHGSLAKEATEAMQEVATAVIGTGKAGKFTVEVTIDRIGELGVAITLGGKVTQKLPLPAAAESVAYVGEDGQLFRDDPTLRLPGFDPGTGEIKE